MTVHDDRLAYKARSLIPSHSIRANRLRDTLAPVSEQPSVREAFETLLILSSGIGYRWAAVAMTRSKDHPEGALLATNLPQSWMDEYSRDRLVDHDTMAERLRTSVAEFTFAEHDRDWHQPRKQKKMRDAMVRHGMLDGYAVSFDCGDIHGFVGFSADRIVNLHKTDRMVLRGASEFVFNLAAGAKPALPQSAQKLSQQEVVVLSWVAEGMRTEGIAKVMGITPHTVNSYIKEACAKLGANSRIHAVALATRLGFLHQAF